MATGLARPSLCRGRTGETEMTPEQSKELKVGTRVCFNDERADRGTVTAIQLRYVTIKWEDGHRSYTGHKEMKRVELLDVKQ
jgi:hypothetical protein